MSMPTPGEARSRQTAYLATEAWWKTRVEEIIVAFRANADVNPQHVAAWELAARRLEFLLAERPSR